MASVRAILLRPLDGREIGSEATFTAADFKRLAARGAVKRAPPVRNKASPAPANKAASGDAKATPAAAQGGTGGEDQKPQG